MTTNSIEVERHFMQSIDELLAREETMWRQRSRVDWLKEGDHNTAFFHARASQRHKKKLIKEIQDNQRHWIEEENRVEDVVVNYFKSIFSSSQPHITVGDLEGVEQRVTADMNLALMREFQPHEVQNALFQMHPTKAPGPDGMSPLFYQKYWHIVGADITHATLSFLRGGLCFRILIIHILS